MAKLLYCTLAVVVVARVHASVITYYMDDFKTCGAFIKDGNMDEDDAYVIKAYQWADELVSPRYSTMDCSIALDFVNKRIKLTFESFYIRDCDVQLNIFNTINAEGTGIISRLTCNSSQPETVLTGSSTLRLALTRGKTKNYFYSLRITTEGTFINLTSGVITGIVLGVVFLFLLILAAAIFLVVCRRRRKMRKRMQLAYQSPAILEREEGLTIINRLGISHEDAPEERPRASHRRAYRTSYVSTSSQHTPTGEGPPPYQSHSDLSRGRGFASRAEEEVFDPDLTVTSADLTSDNGVTLNNSFAEDEAFLPHDLNMHQSSDNVVPVCTSVNAGSEARHSTGVLDAGTRTEVSPVSDVNRMSPVNDYRPRFTPYSC